MKEKTLRVIGGVFFILLFLIVLVGFLNVPIRNTFVKYFNWNIIYLRLFFFPLFFLGYILFQKLFKGKTWASLKSDIIYGSLFTVFSVAIYAFLFL